MLNAGKIRLMTDLAIYEKEHGDNVFRINNFYKSDYLVSNLVSAFARYTVCFFLLLIYAVVFWTELFFSQINAVGISDMFVRLGVLYGGGLLLYLLIAFKVYSARYKRAKRGVLLYATKLKRLIRKY